MKGPRGSTFQVFDTMPMAMLQKKICELFAVCIVIEYYYHGSEMEEIWLNPPNF